MICLKIWLQRLLEGSTVLWFPDSLFGWVEAESVGSYLFSLEETQIMPFRSLRSTHPLENGPLKPAHILACRIGLNKHCRLFLCCFS